MPIITVTTYGPGGYDPDAGDSNIADQREIEVPELRSSVEDRLADVEAAVLGDSAALLRVQKRIEADAR